MKLTFNNDIIGESGLIHYSKGQVVELERLNIREGYFGKGSGVWYRPKILSVYICENEFPTSFLPDCFEEEIPIDLNLE